MSSHQTLHYNYQQPTPNLLQKMDLPCEQNAGHGDHWAILTDNIGQDVPNWLQKCWKMHHYLWVLPPIWQAMLVYC